MKTRWFVVIESRGSWWVDCEGRAFGPLESKAEAASYAQKLADIHSDPDRRSDVWVPADDGKLRLIWSGPAPVRAA
jgi:hypothetical protein